MNLKTYLKVLTRFIGCETCKAQPKRTSEIFLPVHGASTKETIAQDIEHVKQLIVQLDKAKITITVSQDSQFNQTQVKQMLVDSGIAARYFT